MTYVEEVGTFVKFAEITIRAVPDPDIQVDGAAFDAAHDVFTDPVIHELAEAIRLRIQYLVPSWYGPVITISGTEQGYKEQDGRAA